MESSCANQTSARFRRGFPAGMVRRLRGAAVCALAVAAILLLAGLRPDPSGVGTHEQLCLPACSYLVRTGWPCPTCGLTTSLAAMARGDVGLAFRAHPFGVVVFVGLVAAVLLGGMGLLTARPMLAGVRPRLWWAAAAVGGLLLGWAVKMAVGWACGELPIR